VSVKIWTFDREATIARLREWAERLGRDSNVLAVVLFGSLARGDATAASDADVLVLLRDSDTEFSERTSRLKPLGLVRAGVEIFAYTIAEAERSLDEGWGVVPIALQKGRILFEHPGTLASLGRGRNGATQG
jgi:uncharacterized protein